jgi:hypothetical protein
MSTFLDKRNIKQSNTAGILQQMAKETTCDKTKSKKIMYLVTTRVEEVLEFDYITML